MEVLHPNLVMQTIFNHSNSFRSLYQSYRSTYLLRRRFISLRLQVGETCYMDPRKLKLMKIREASRQKKRPHLFCSLFFSSFLLSCFHDYCVSFIPKLQLKHQIVKSVCNIIWLVRSSQFPRTCSSTLATSTVWSKHLFAYVTPSSGGVGWEFHVSSAGSPVRRFRSPSRVEKRRH
jgi:hypothetical protein